MTETPGISTVLPTFNPDVVQLAATIHSIVGQKGVSELELIVVDDSKDDRVARLLGSADAFRHVKLVAGPGKGVGAARSAGYKLAKFDWIAHMDADDVAHSSRFAHQAKAIQAGADICGTNTVYIGDRRGVQTFIESDEAIRFSLAFGAFLSQPSLMVNRSRLGQDGLYGDLDVCEDYESWCRWAAKGYVLRNLRQRLLSYRVHAAQATAQKRERIEHAASRIRSGYVAHGDYSEDFKKFFAQHGQEAWSVLSAPEVEEYWHVTLAESKRWHVDPQDVLRIFYAVFGRSPRLSPRLLASTAFLPRAGNFLLDVEMQIKSKASITRKLA